MSGSTVVVIILSALVILLLVWVVLISYNLGIFRRSQRILTRGMTDNNLADILAQHFVRTDGLEDRIAHLEYNVSVLHDIQLGAVQRIGLVRYDAFRDMGGELSFALALLDQRGDGLVVSTITGRKDNRTYAKQVRGGKTDVAPLAEENEAIKQAMSRR